MCADYIVTEVKVKELLIEIIVHYNKRKVECGSMKAAFIGR